jgi:hypothetical protein
MSTAPPFARVVFDYRALVDAFRERSDQLEMTRLELDRLSYLAPGHSGRLLSPNSINNKNSRGFGIKSLGDMMQALGLIIMLVEDPGARDKTLARRVPFEAKHRRIGNKNNSKPQIEASAKVEQPALRLIQNSKPEPASRSHLRVVQPRRGKTANNAQTL